MAFKYVFKLKADASPHLYINHIKNMIDEDGYLHPMMKQALLMLKKTKMPYILLATEKEIIFSPIEFMHFERALTPTLTGWSRVKWCEEEKQALKADAKKFFTDMLNGYKKLGYEISSKEDINEEKLNEIKSLTEKQK